MICNPMFTGEPVGGAFINLILLGYGIPAVLAIVLAMQTRDVAAAGLSHRRRGLRGPADAELSRRSRCAGSTTGRC